MFSAMLSSRAMLSCMRRHQAWTPICSLYSFVSPFQGTVEMSSSSNVPSHSRHQDKASYSQNSQQRKRLHRKDNFQRKWEDVKVDGPNSRPHRTSGVKTQSAKPSDVRSPPWLNNIHRRLMKSIDLPPALSAGTDVHRYSQEALQALSTGDLMSMAQRITYIDHHTMKVIVALWRRFDSITVEDILTVADIFYLNNVPAPWYASAMITYAAEMFEALSFTPLQLLRLMFHIRHHGSAPPSLVLDIEERMKETLTEFDMNQVAIICQLFFLGQNRIRSPVLVDQIAMKLIQEFDSLNPANLPMLMKMFRFSNFVKISFYKELGDRLVSSNYFSHFQTSSQIMHFAFTYASVRITHPQLFTYILMECKKNSTKHRLKDIAKVIWACGTLVTNQVQHIECIHEIAEQLQRSITMKQVEEFPDNLMDLLMGLALLNIYPQKLINMVFDPHIIQLLTDLNPDREKFLQLQFLDQSLSIECPHYMGSRLSEADRKVVTEHLKDLSVDMDIQLRKSIKPAVTALQNALGSESVQCKFVLPHFKTSDIVLAYDGENKVFVKPDKETSVVTSTDNAEADNRIQRLVLMLLSRAQTTYDSQPLGMIQCKTRQLSTLGYKVITIDAEEALSYACLDQESTQKLLLNHISTAVGADVTTNLSCR